MAPLDDASTRIGQRTGSVPFVGRRHELASLADALPGPDRRGALRLIRGEPGAGKSRLTEEVAALARERGVSTIVGRCWDSGEAPPYWPWVHALRSLPGVERRNDLAELVSDDPAGGGDRFALFDSTAAFLATVTNDAPLVIVLDDLHDADVGSLLLARFLSLELDRLPVLILGTYRPVEAAQRPSVAEHLSALERSGDTIALAGVSVDEVFELLGDTDRRVAADVHGRTGGNPLFVLHHSSSSAPSAHGGASSDLPMGLRSAVRSWLAPIDESVREALCAVAMLGPAAATVDRVAALTRCGVLEVGNQLQEAATTGLLRPIDASGELGLAHPLIGEVLIGDLESEPRRRWHVEVAERLAAIPEHRAEVAGHLIAAGAGHEAAAIEACRRAADQATAAQSHEEAVEHLETAAALLDSRIDATARQRFDLLLDLGSARWRAGRRAGADEAFDAASSRAVELGDADGLAVAALGGGFRSDYSGDASSRRAERLRTALDAITCSDNALRSRLLAELVVNEHASIDPEAAVARACEAVTMARRSTDPRAIGYALVARQVVELGPESLPERLATCREILALAQRTGDHELALQGRFHLVGALLEAGDLRAVDVELVAQSRVVDQLAEPAYSRHALWFRCMRLIVEGRAEEAEVVAGTGLSAANAASDPDGILVFGGQLALIRWLQGRVGEMEPLWIDLRRDEPDNPLWMATLAWLWATTGQLDAARGAVTSMVDLDTVPQDRHWLLTMTALAEAVAVVGASELAEELRSLLLPYADRVVPVSMGIAWWGSVARPLGLLADVLGRRDEAGQHFASAVELTARLGARPWLAQSQLDRAHWELAGGVHRDSTGQLVAEAASTIEVWGPLGLRDRAAQLGAAHEAMTGSVGVSTEAVADAAGAPEADPPRGAKGGTRPSIAVLGTFEVAAADGTVARWTSRKARELVKFLVSRRGSPVPRDQLMGVLWPGEDPAKLGNRLSVAVSTIRRALDPGRQCPVQKLIVVDRDSVQLRLDHVDVDVEQFIASSRAALRQLRETRHTGADTTEVYSALGRALAMHRGDPIADDPYAEWAEPLRSETRSIVVTVASELAALAEAAGDDLLAVGAFRRVLEVDPFDEPSHQGLIRVFEVLGAHGQAQHAQRAYRSAMAELGVETES